MSRNWIMASGALYNLVTTDSATASYFFNTPLSFCTGASNTASPVPSTLAATPVRTYSKFSDFALDVNNGNLTFPYQWVMYDLEDWASSLVGEKNDPLTYMKAFGELAHSVGYKVIQAPAADLANVSGISGGETNEQWYIRSGIAAQAAAYGDLLVVQGESLQTTVPAFQWFYLNARQQAQAANPGIPVCGEVSTANGTTTQMATAAQSLIAPAGFYVAAPSPDTTGADAFWVAIKTAGY